MYCAMCKIRSMANCRNTVLCNINQISITMIIQPNPGRLSNSQGWRSKIVGGKKTADLRRADLWFRTLSASYRQNLACRRNMVPGRVEPPVTVILLSPGVSGAWRHLGFASESSLCSSRFLLYPNILSGQCIPSGESSGSVQLLAQFVLTPLKIYKRGNMLNCSIVKEK